MKRTNTAADVLNTNIARIDVGDGIIIPLPADGSFGGGKGEKGEGVPEGGAPLQVVRKSAAGTTTEWATLTPATVGLTKVDNTADTEKPISEPQKQVLDNKADLLDGKVVASQLPDITPVTDSTIAPLINGAETAAAIDSRINQQVAPQVEQITASYIAGDRAVVDAAAAAVNASPKIAEIDNAIVEVRAALPYRGLWAGGGDMDTWRASMRGTWEVRDATGYARPANFPPNVAASVPSVVTIDATAGGHAVQTVKPTGNGQSEWFRVSKNYTGAGSANWSGWRRMDSSLRPRLAEGTNIDTLRLQADEGSVSITQAQAATLIGLPEPGAFGSLHTQVSLDGLASQFFHQLTTGGGATRLWWRMVNHATTFTWGPWQLLTAGGAGQVPTGTTRAPIILTTGGGPSATTTQNTVHARLPINVPAKVNRWRAHFRNYNYRDAAPYAGALAFASVVFGAGAVDSSGRPTGQWAGTPTQIMGATSTPANAAAFSTPWIDSSPIEPATEYLLGYAYTGAEGQTSYLGVGGGWLGSDTTTLTKTDTALTRQQYMPLDVWLEVETAGGVELVAYFGDSLTAGVSSELPVYDSYPMRHARANGHLPVIYAASGSAMNLWANSASGQVTRWAGMSKPSKLYWSMGSNDVFQPVDIATLRARFAAALPVITGATSRNVILTTILPRLNASAAAEAVRKEWNQILMDELPGNAVMCMDAAAALTDDTAGVLDVRWRATATDIHLSKQGYAKFASTL